MKPLTRRDFLLSSGACGALTLTTPFCGRAETDSPFSDGRKRINPAIDNLSVVCGLNQAMITGVPSSWEMEGQNGVIDSAQVERTLDAMAIALVKGGQADAAWESIFLRPADKAWSAVTVAIKVNCIAENHPRLAVVNKLCAELLHRGIKPENVIIYDGVHNAAPLYASYVGKGLPLGVRVSEKFTALGGMAKIEIPEPRKGKASCARALADNAIDILIDIAVNKGHSKNFGGTTLTMKNHAGTFDPKPLHLGGGMDYLIAFNKSHAIRGLATPRQQLCIIDSLWGAKKGPGGVPDVRLDRLVMGTLSPVVDYLTAKKIREPLLQVSHPDIERLVTEFGYTPDEIPDINLVTLS